MVLRMRYHIDEAKEMVGLLAVVVTGLVAVCQLRPVHGLIAVPLNLRTDGVAVTASAECAAGELYAVCEFDSSDCWQVCGAPRHGAQLVVDGDITTSWQSPTAATYASSGQSMPPHTLTIDLGQVVPVQRVRVWRGEGGAPSGIELSGSLDGVTFTTLTPELTFPQESLVIDLVSQTSGEEMLTTELLQQILIHYLRITLFPPVMPLVNSDPTSAFFSVGEVDVLGVCLNSVNSSLCQELVRRRTSITLQDTTLHRLLWQRSSEFWILDDVIVNLERCVSGAEAGCQAGTVREDFNSAALNPLLWDSDSFPSSVAVVPHTCPDPALLVAPGNQIISRPLFPASRELTFDVQFLCQAAAEPDSQPVELRLCRSIEGVLGECQLIALVTTSDCGNCLDQLTSQLVSLQERLGSALFPANLTILEILHDDIHFALDDLERLEGYLVVLEVGTGTVPFLPNSSLPLAPGVPRLDLQLVPTILHKLEQLQNLTENMPNITVVSREDLLLLFSNISASLQPLLTEANQLRSRQRVLSFEVAARLQALSNQREALSLARGVAERTERQISNRDYNTTVFRVAAASAELAGLLEAVRGYQSLAVNNSGLSQELGARQPELRGMLTAAGSLAAGTVGVASQAVSIIAETQTAEDSLQALMREAAEGLREGEERVSEAEVAVRNGGELLTEARAHIQNTSGEVPAISVLIDQLNQSVQSDRPRLADLLTSDCTSEADNCTAGEEHSAELATNLTYLVNSSVSVYTLLLATDTLIALGSAGKPLDLSLINETALLAQERAQEAVDILGGVNFTLKGVASVVLLYADQLRQTALASTSASQDVLGGTEDAGERTVALSLSMGEVEGEAAALSERLEAMASLEEVRQEALEIAGRANASSEVVRGAGERVGGVRVGAEEVERDIAQIQDNREMAESVLESTQQPFPLISRLLMATEVQAKAAIANISGFLSENERILADIDSLISQLSDVHASISLINSPVRLSSESAAAAVPYLSLQPPPGRTLEDGVQFEDIDLYLWPSAQYQTPSLLFYAGPVRFPDQENGTRPENREDVVWVIAEEEQLRLGWELGGYYGDTTYTAKLEGDSQMRLTRVGSQFRLQFSPSSEPALQTYSLVNNSLLFHSSPRTAFLLGGWPQGSELGSEARPLSLAGLSGFEGQFQLALFNGGPWGLWNVRSTSPTDLIGDMEFRRNELTQGLAWHASTGLSRTASVLSFDGLGYLFTQQLGTVAMFGGSFFQIMTLYLRPNDASRGLVMYAYQMEISLSLEVFFREGQLHVLVSLHESGGREILVDHSETASLSASGELELQIRYVPGFRRYTVNGVDYNLASSSGQFFTNLQQVRAWFGGVREDQLESGYVPQEMSGYFGCIDMIVRRVITVFEVFRGASFTQYYLNSPIQSRLSATCYDTVYVREVSFATGTEGLAYTYLPLPPLSSTCAPSLPLSLSLSLLPLEPDGVLIAARDGESSVLVRQESGVVVVMVSVGGDSLSLFSQQTLGLGLWHHLHISVTSSSPQELQLFVDGVLHDATPFALASFALDLPTSAPVGVANPLPVLFVGGVTVDFDTTTSYPMFTGCMRDLTFDLCPLSFQSRALVDRYPPGVGYHSCPSVTIVSVPELPVQAESPQQRLCLAREPVELSAAIGFAQDTGLQTSNIIGFFGSEWTLSFALRQRREGHVISVRGEGGAVVTVDLVSGARVALTVSSGGQEDMGLTTEPFPHDTFSDITVVCSVTQSLLHCNLTVAGQSTAVVEAEAAVNGSVFDPALPISLGLTTDKLGNTVEGFEGCIRDLAVNGDKTGFQGVETGVPCYNETVPGLGLTGISRISDVLPRPAEVGGEVGVSLTVKPLLETGVVLVLTTPTTDEPILLVGLVQGELRASQLNSEYTTLARGLCDSADEMTFDLSVRYTVSELTVSVTVRAAAVGSVSYPPPSPLTEFGQLQLTIGHLPERLSANADPSLLVSEEMLPAAQPAGLVGCLLTHSVQGLPLNLQTSSHSNVLDGFCPDG